MKKQKKQKINIPTDRVAIAPYNFVPLPDRVITLDLHNDKDKIDHARYANNRNTGQIVCTLKTETDLYIRSGLTAKEFAAQRLTAVETQDPILQLLQADVKNKPQFFSIANSNQPVIPASSLRGMIRSLVEIASFSKVGWVSKRKPFFRSLGDKALQEIYQKEFVNIELNFTDGHNPKSPLYITRAKMGKLRKTNSGWVIDQYEFGRIEHDEIKRVFGINRIVNNGIPNQSIQNKQIWFQLGSKPEHFFKKQFTPSGKLRHEDLYLRYQQVISLSKIAKPDYREGLLVITGHMQHKHLEFVLFTDTILREIPVDQKLFDRFHDDDQISQWQEQAFPQDGGLNDGDPVFFLTDEQDENQLKFFGRAQMFRLPYEFSPNDLLPDVHRANTLDLAEAIFGFVRQTKTNDQNRAAVNNSLSQEGEKEQALAGRVFFSNAHLSPEQGDVLKETQITQILASPKPTTFQHYLVQENTTKDELEHYSTKGAVIRGRKLYWHQQPSNAYTTDIKQVEKAKTQYTCITPVNPGTTFEFTIRFENLSDVELGALLWVLDLASCSGKYRFKLGMGKPLGLGSVAINYELQLTNRKQRYQHLFDDDGNWETGTETASTSARNKIIDAFQAFIDDNLDMDIEETEQIQQLRALLEWRKGKGLKFDGFIDKELSSALRYMEIARSGSSRLEDKPNEYSSRRVLPLPTQVNNDSIQAIKKYPKVLEEDDEIQVKIIDLKKDGRLTIAVFGLIDGVNQQDGLAIIEQDNLYGKNYNEGNRSTWIIIRIEKRINKKLYFCKPKNQ